MVGKKIGGVESERSIDPALYFFPESARLLIGEGATKNVTKCGNCGTTRLKRVHRDFWDRWRYVAVYECPECRSRLNLPHRYRFHLGPEARCPRCGTYRLTKL